MRVVVVCLLWLAVVGAAHGTPATSLDEALSRLAVVRVEVVPEVEKTDAPVRLPVLVSAMRAEASQLRARVMSSPDDEAAWRRLLEVGGVGAVEVAGAIEALCVAELGPVRQMPSTAYCTAPGAVAGYLARVRRNRPLSRRLHLALASESFPDDVAALLLSRADVVGGALADALRERVARDWRACVRSYVVAGLAAGHGDAFTLQSALQQRARMPREALLKVVRTGGAAAGVAAVLLDDQGVIAALLDGSDRPAQRALFIAARAIRAAQPLDRVERLAAVAEVRPALLAWLQEKDDPAERRLLARLEPVSVVGSSQARRWVRKRPWDRGYHVEPRAWESALRLEMQGASAPHEIVALYEFTPSRMGARVASTVVRVRGDRATVTVTEDAACLRERDLRPEELAALRKSMEEAGANLLPSLDLGVGVFTESLHLTRTSAARTAVDLTSGFLHEMGKRDARWRRYAWMQRLSDLGAQPGRLVYSVVSRSAGARLLSADGSVDTVWARGDDVRVRVDDRGWLRLGAEGTWAASKPPVGVSAPFVRWGGPWASPPWLLDSRRGRFNVTEAGVWLGARRVARGKIDAPAASSDGRYLLGARASARGPGCVVIDTVSRRERRVGLDGALWIEPLGWNPWRKRFVLYWHRWTPSRLGPVEPLHRQYVEIDPVTGRVTPYPGDGRPWMEHPRRPLQDTRRQACVWVALPDDARNQTTVGRLDLRTLRVSRLANFPSIVFEQRDMWVDSGFVYVVHKGNVLRLSLGSRGCE